jgi:hypothetical protein
MTSTPQFTAFEGDRRLAAGSRQELIKAINARLSDRPDASILVFDDATGAQVDFDLRHGAEHRPAAPQTADETRGPGRPKLGVVAREVTLLPRHWDWLGTQPGGASVTLRKLVEEARRANSGAANARDAQERAYRFMSAIAGNLPGFEEAARALFSSDGKRFAERIAEWPHGVRDYAQALADGAFASS